jgi:hypothetical protein
VTIMLGMKDGYYMPFDPTYLAIFQDTLIPVPNRLNDWLFPKAEG